MQNLQVLLRCCIVYLHLYLSFKIFYYIVMKNSDNMFCIKEEVGLQNKFYWGLWSASIKVCIFLLVCLGIYVYVNVTRQVV